MRYIDIARKHGLGLEEITEDKTGEKPQEIVNKDGTSEKEGSVVSVENNNYDKAKAETTDEKIEAVKNKLDDIANVLDNFARENKKDKDKNKPVVSNEGTAVLEPVSEPVSDDSVTVTVDAPKGEETPIVEVTVSPAEDTVTSTEEVSETEKVDTAAESAVVEGEAATSETVSTGDASVPETPAVVTTDVNLTVSNEGWKGAYEAAKANFKIYGWKDWLIPFHHMSKTKAFNEKMLQDLKDKEKQLEEVSKKLKEVATIEGMALVKEGKLKQEDFERFIKNQTSEKVSLSFLNSDTQIIANMFKGSKTENLQKEIDKKLDELAKLVGTITDAKIKENQNPSTEEHSGDLEGVAVSAPLEENDAGADAGVIAKNADAEMISEKEDMEHAGKELSEAIETVEVLEKTKVSVESHYEVVNYNASRRGISRHHAISIGIGLESVLEDFGIEASKIVPPLESFGLEEEKKETTKKFAAKLKDIIAAIMRALAKAYEVVLDKSQELLSRVKHWSPGLKTAIKLTKSTLAKGEVKDTITVPVSVRRALYIGKDGEVSIASLTGNAAAFSCAALIEFNEAIKTSGKVAKDAFMSFMNSSPESAITSLKNSIRQNEISLKPGSTTPPKDFIAPDGYTVLSGTEELPGGKFILSMAPMKEDGGFDYSKMISGVKQVRPEDSITEPTTISNVTKEDMENVINTVENIVSSLDKLVSARQSSIAVYKGIVSAMENYGKSLDKEFKGTEEQAAEIKDLLTYNTELCRANIKLSSTNIDAGIAYIVRGVASPILDLVRASVKRPSRA